MTVRECYESVGSDYDKVLGRLGSDRVIQKFAGKFLNDPNYRELGEALKVQDAERAFRAAHTLKGVCLNLGFDKLYEASASLTEQIRDRDLTGYEPFYKDVQTEYKKLADAIAQLDS